MRKAKHLVGQISNKSNIYAFTGVVAQNGSNAAGARISVHAQGTVLTAA